MRFVDALIIGVTRCWHLLDTGATSTRLTVLAVHGNPTWSYTWRHLAAGPDDVRVIAPDQLEMGFSGAPVSCVGWAIASPIWWRSPTCSSQRRRGRGRSRLGRTGLLGLVAASVEHDSLDVVGLVLTNTAVHQPTESSAPT